MININVTDNLLHYSFTTASESGHLFQHMQMKMAICSSLWYSHFEKFFLFLEVIVKWHPARLQLHLSGSKPMILLCCLIFVLW